MLLTVKDACELHPMALDYAMGEQIENLSEVIRRQVGSSEGLGVDLGTGKRVAAEVYGARKFP